MADRFLSPIGISLEAAGIDLHGPKRKDYGLHVQLEDSRSWLLHIEISRIPPHVVICMQSVTRLPTI